MALEDDEALEAFGKERGRDEGCYREILEVATKLQNSNSRGFPYRPLTLVAGFIRNYVISWSSLYHSSSIVSVHYGLIYLSNVLKAALQLCKDDQTPSAVNRHFGQVSDIIEDVENYVHIINRQFLYTLTQIQLCKLAPEPDLITYLKSEIELINGLRKKIKEDFALLRLIPPCTFNGHEAHLMGKRYLTPYPKAMAINHRDVQRICDLGSGSFSDVYKARWHGKEVAVKEIKDSRDCEWTDPGIKQELEVHEKLQATDSSHVVRLLGYFDNTINGNKSLVLEFMQSNLQSFIKTLMPDMPDHEDVRHRDFNPSEFQCIDKISTLQQKLDIMIQISKGMRHLHGEKVIHRDLKPANVMVSRIRPGGKLLVKIADFGISKANFRAGDTLTLNKGSLNYMPPEVISLHDSGGYYTEKVDAYSFAMTCAEILSGQMPFLRPIRGDDIQAFKRRLEDGERPDLPTAGKYYRLNHLIRDCWSGNPDSRPTFESITKRLWAVKADLFFRYYPYN